MYGSDVTWQSGESAAFSIFNRLCREQAQAVFAWNSGRLPGLKPTIIPAVELAAQARAAI